MNVGIDVHGVIDLYPSAFKIITANLVKDFHGVHIITGQEWEKIKPMIDDLGIQYTHHFSIVDYHRNKGTKMWKDKKGTFWMDEMEWVRSKGDYIHRENIDIHFDDTWEYANFIPNTCTFILVPKKNFHAFQFIAHFLQYHP